MNIVEIIVIAGGLSLDVFAYMVCKGAVMPEVKKSTLLKVMIIFTVWQTVSFAAGSLITMLPMVDAMGVSVAWDSRYVSVAIFMILGLYMIFKSRKDKQIVEHREENIEYKQIFLWACITSLDAFLAGIGMGFTEIDFLLTAGVMIVTTIVAVIGGLYAGWWMGCRSPQKIVLCGGLILLIGSVELVLRSMIAG